MKIFWLKYLMVISPYLPIYQIQKFLLNSNFGMEHLNINAGIIIVNSRKQL